MQALAYRTSVTAKPCSIVPLPIQTPRPHETEAAQFRQLRTQTKGTLQRILDLVATTPELQASAGGREISRALYRRIQAAATISDALFGIIRHPGSFQNRLGALSHAVVHLYADDLASIAVNIEVHSICPVRLQTLLLHAANTLVANAVQHGMHARVLGRIDVHVTGTATHTVLTVTDDGWGFTQTEATPDGGLSTLRALAHRHGGEITLQRRGQHSVATLQVPHAPPTKVANAA